MNPAIIIKVDFWFFNQASGNAFAVGSNFKNKKKLLKKP